MARTHFNLGLGIGWRPELAHFIDRRTDLGFVEITAENHRAGEMNRSLDQLRARGVKIIPHGISVSLGGAERIDAERVDHLEKLAKQFDAPLVSEHIAFVRAGGIELGHLTPIARTRASLEVLVENVKFAQSRLSVPLALENIAAMVEWPDAQMSETRFLNELVDRTGVMLLLDLSNLHANACNLKFDARTFLTELPLDRIAYVHMGGGVVHDGIVKDTHSDPILPGAMKLLREFRKLNQNAGVMVERDDHFPSETEMTRELDEIARVM